MLASSSQNDPRVIVIMGVAASGKSTVGTLVAHHLDCAFVEGDAYHPPANVAKMKSGQPLTDSDRAPWLAAVAATIEEMLLSGTRAVVACSALKPEYRKELLGSVTAFPFARVVFVLLEPGAEELQRRAASRAAQSTHFMPPALLASQLSTLRYDPAELFLHIKGAAAEGSAEEIAEAVVRRINGIVAHE